MTILAELKKRNLPKWTKTQSQLQTCFLETEFGLLPPAPYTLKFKVLECNEDYLAGKAVYKKISIYGSTSAGDFSFPICFIEPKSAEPLPVIININFRPEIPDLYLPSEELCDKGFSVLSVYYNEITTDDGDFTNGLGSLVNRENSQSAGKITLWAWALMRCVDFLETQESADLESICVSGHSRLGKTALLAGALDNRFKFVFANNSGCCGAALHRGKTGESIKDITTAFPHWFCPSFSAFANKENELPFDHHQLLGLIAPRYLYISAAAEDAWADPFSEFLSCTAATEIFKEQGAKGLVAPLSTPAPLSVYHSGKIGFHLREGTHFLSRTDWNLFTDFVLLKIKEEKIATPN